MPWQYKPSTASFSLEPSSAAYASGLTRDNIYRQSFSFFLILCITDHPPSSGRPNTAISTLSKASFMNGGDLNTFSDEPETELELTEPHPTINNLLAFLFFPYYWHGGYTHHLKKRYYTPLHLAAHRGRADIVEFLVENGAELEALSKALCRCRYVHNLRFYQDMEPANEVPRWFPIHHAIYGDHLAIVKLLYSLRPAPATSAISYSPPALPQFGVTAIQSAAANGNLEILSYLLGETTVSEAQRTDYNGDDAIHYSTLCRSRSAMQSVMTALGNKGLTVRDFDVAGGPKGHLDSAIQTGNWSAVLEILRRTQGNANPAGHDACRMLHSVVVDTPFGGRCYEDWQDTGFSRGDWEEDYRAVIPALAARALLGAGMSTEGKSSPGFRVEYQDVSGVTPLVAVARYAGRREPDPDSYSDWTLMPLTELVRAGADFTSTSVDGKVPLVHCLESLWIGSLQIPVIRELIGTMVRETAKAGGRDLMGPIIAWAIWKAENYHLAAIQALLLYLTPALLSKRNLKKLFKFSRTYEDPSSIVHKDKDCIMEYLAGYCKRNALDDEIARICTGWLNLVFYERGGDFYQPDRDFLCEHLLSFLDDESKSTLPTKGGPMPLVDLYVLRLALNLSDTARGLACWDGPLSPGWIFQIDSWPTTPHLAVKAGSRNAVLTCIEDRPNVNAVVRYGGRLPAFNAKTYVGSAPLHPRGSRRVPIPGESETFHLTTVSEFVTAALQKINQREADTVPEQNKRLEASAYEMAMELGRDDPEMARLAAAMIERHPYPAIPRKCREKKVRRRCVLRERKHLGYRTSKPRVYGYEW
ncbi:ankyrin repeat-containing domain protein [Podospora appendiculata]|uniref:Ankyrin repeat-containing domain protein n=1 Tax=Podospora appendiculata TaxID=314037 RepID=A0AAE0X060_9PEZI|nr:ankyrin repeat-containing domain protein [Podospora appendiculata]